MTFQTDTGPESAEFQRDRARGLTHALPLAKTLHWATASVVLFLFVFGVLMTQLGGGVVAEWLNSAHKVLGVVAIMLLLARLLTRAGATVGGRWRGNARGRFIHWIIYGMALLVGLLGWAAISDYGARKVFFGLQLPSIWPEGTGYAGWFFTAHVWLAFLLMALILVHIGLALHDYVTRRAEG